ncbi:hypothetical protein PVAP13_6NG061001 [Panicum virgatum]|uniref:Uncharacterized protein n=1 Tax=Panicum virgatum TaxID=38727 RepID=A0A8T0QV20_PANVG|nr:hypothetical protein PVAP13_6NG061001 [Panicum virgatum]
MDSWEEEVRIFMLEEEEEDDELFFVLVPALQLGMYDEKEPEHTSVLTVHRRDLPAERPQMKWLHRVFSWQEAL